MKHVDKQDLADKSKENLRIRKGCGAKVCGCLGICLEIIGEITRKEYEEFLENYTTEEEFLTNKCSN